jgi:3'-5' exoribonuclease
MALGDISKIKALIILVEKAETARGGGMLKLRYSGEDAVERFSVMFENKSTVFPDLESIANQVCELTVEESSYNGKPSTKILNVIPLPGEDRKNYLRKSKIDVDAAVADMKAVVGSDPDLGGVLSMILFDNAEMLKRYKSWPAAKGAHHAFEGGLIEHTYMMFKGAQAIMGVDVAYKDVDKNVVLAAIVLHDVGKVVEYEYEPGLKSNVTNIGMLLGHISIADSMIVRACTKKDIAPMSGRMLQMRHCILAHHGKKDWGSPVTPATLEATLVHQMDMIQSRGEMTLEGLEQVEVGQTNFVKTLETNILRWK